MKQLPHDPFRHNAWATLRLVERCRELGPAELTAATAPGTYGTVLDTLVHLLRAEGGYRFRLTGRYPDWSWGPPDAPPPSLEQLHASAEESVRFWEDFLLDGPEPDEVLRLTAPDGSLHDVPAGVVLAQVLNHGNEHRCHVTTVLTTAGVEPPVLDGWAYGMESRRIVPVTA
jgi:uncharacterized damage-inducible protein DinB